MQFEVTGRRIAQNTLFYITALTLQKVLSFVYFTLVARSLGAAQTGKYFFALSLAGIVIGIIDIGLTPVLTREIAKDRSTAKSLLWHTLMLKALLGAVAAIGLTVFSNMFISDGVQRQLVYLALVIALFDTFALSFFATVRAFQNLWYESVSAVVFQLIVLSVGFFGIYYKADVRLAMGALCIGSVVNCALGYRAARSLLADRLIFVSHIDFGVVRRLLYLAFPFALATVCIKANAYTDTLLVKALLDDTAVGLYSVAYKITFAFQFVPMAFVASLYPAFAYLWTADREALRATFMRAVTYLTLISLPIVALVAAVGDIVIPLVYRAEYGGSVLPLVILCASLPLLFVNFPIGSLLNASGHQSRQTLHLAIGVVATVVCNVALIPFFGIVGAALASFISTLVVGVLGMYVAHRLTGFDWNDIVRVVGRISLAGVMLFVVAYVLRLVVPWYIASFAGACVYVAIVWLFGIISRDTVRQIRLLVQR